jgi:Uri superfamily endonuclease
LTLRNKMESNKQNWLIDYLVSVPLESTGTVPRNERLEETLSKMSADDIIQSILKARDIRENLKTFSLGRELF